MTRVVVAGAGIVGAAVAYECVRAGAEVLLLDRSLPGHGVTADSFAWIGEPRPGDAPDPSTALRRGVLAGYRRWEAEVPGVRVRWHGSLSWPGGDLDATQVARLEPHLSDPPARAAFEPSDGTIDPVAVTQALAGAAQIHGARLLPMCVATAVTSSGVRTTKGFFAADTVIIAAGVDAPVLCAPLGYDLPVSPSPALLMRFSAPPGLVRTLIDSPGLEVREAEPGLLLVATAPDGDAQQVLRRLRAAFGTGDVRLLSVRVGARPMPADGLPVIGPVPGAATAYLAVLHSGVTLAPAVARLVAAEVVGDGEAGELAGLRPSRFG